MPSVVARASVEFAEGSLSDCMGAVEDLRNFGAPVDDATATAAFINTLNIASQAKARLLREYLRQSHNSLSREILVAARDYQFYL